MSSSSRRQFFLDGELVCFDEDGKPDSERLRSRLVGRRGAAAAPSARLMIFDVLHLDGGAVRALP